MIGFDSTTCTCEPAEIKNVRCNLNTCKLDEYGKNSDDNVRPMNPGCKPGPTAQCSNENGFRCPMLYFSYNIEDPISALGNVLAGGINAGNKVAGSIFDYLKWGGFIIAGILILYIIYKVLSIRNENEFGKNIIGNINKFSSYSKIYPTY